MANCPFSVDQLLASPVSRRFDDSKDATTSEITPDTTETTETSVVIGRAESVPYYCQLQQVLGTSAQVSPIAAAFWNCQNQQMAATGTVPQFHAAALLAAPAGMPFLDPFAFARKFLTYLRFPKISPPPKKISQVLFFES